MKYDVVGFGESSIDEVWLLPDAFALGDKVRARERQRLGGGQIATALVAAARLGARTAFLGPLGEDPIGDEIAAGLAAERVQVLGDRRGQSRVALVLVAQSGERSIVEAGGGAGETAPLPDTRALHVDGTQAAGVALAGEAHAGGLLVSVDLDLASQFPLSIEHADLCVLSEGFPAKWPEQVRRARDRGAFVVETLGARGVRYEGDIIPAFGVDVVDTTACGDTFRGALIVAWLEGLRDRTAVRFASAAAALKCRELGRRGCPTRAEVDALLRKS